MVEEAAEADRGFPFRATASFVSRMKIGDPLDPLLLQVLPQAAECRPVPGFRADPLAERAAAEPDLLRKYPGRMLIVTPGPCAIHCRYCFRRHYAHDRPPAQTASLWARALETAAADPSIEEVILSGGDPLGLPDAELAGFATSLARIGHVRRLRIHTRFPVAQPSRVRDALLAWLTSTRLVPIVVLQINHPAEIDELVAQAVRRLADARILLFNQSVLLAGVNDRADVLASLCERLIELGVVPYYLHQLDRVAGAAHFEVPESAGRALMRQLRDRLPGYAVPRYVREAVDGGRTRKQPLG